MKELSDYAAEVDRLQRDAQQSVAELAALIAEMEIAKCEREFKTANRIILAGFVLTLSVVLLGII